MYFLHHLKLFYKKHNFTIISRCYLRMSNISSFTFKKIDIVDEGTNDLVNHYISK